MTKIVLILDVIKIFFRKKRKNSKKSLTNNNINKFLTYMSEIC